MKLMFLVLGILVLALGVGCLNYTTGSGADHHRTWAEKNGFPEPSGDIYILGVACTVAGAGVAGFTLGRPKKK
jgi:hypothetical protein